MVLENLYYTENYKNHWLKYGILFDDKYYEKDKKVILNNDYYMINKKYTGFIHEKDIIGYERNLYKNDELVYSYKSDDSRLLKIIKHTNNNDYFFFNRDLTGFSILDLNHKNKEFNFYYNKPIYNAEHLNGVWIFIDLEYSNGKILFYGFYLFKEDSGAYKRVFNYMIYNFYEDVFNNQKYINLVDVRKFIYDKYNYNLDANYKAYFKEDYIAVEDILNNKSFIVKHDEY